MSGALEIEIESAWVALTKMPVARQRTVFLTPHRRVVWYSRDLSSPRCIEIGTYRRDVPLADFRDDVFWANEQLRNAA